ESQDIIFLWRNSAEGERERSKDIHVETSTQWPAHGSDPARGGQLNRGDALDRLLRDRYEVSVIEWQNNEVAGVRMWMGCIEGEQAVRLGVILETPVALEPNRVRGRAAELVLDLNRSGPGGISQLIISPRNEQRHRCCDSERPVKTYRFGFVDGFD